MSLKQQLFLLFLIPFTSNSQSLQRKETAKLFSIVEKKLNSKSNNARIEANTEFFFLILETDSLGIIDDTHCYADIKMKDSSCFALSELRKEDFAN